MVDQTTVAHAMWAWFQTTRIAQAVAHAASRVPLFSAVCRLEPPATAMLDDYGGHASYGGGTNEWQMIATPDRESVFDTHLQTHGTWRLFSRLPVSVRAHLHTLFHRGDTEAQYPVAVEQWLATLPVTECIQVCTACLRFECAGERRRCHVRTQQPSRRTLLVPVTLLRENGLIAQHTLLVTTPDFIPDEPIEEGIRAGLFWVINLRQTTRPYRIV